MGQDQFLTLAHIAARTRQEQVLGQLLGDGGAAAHFAAPGFFLLLVVFPGLADGLPFHAVMLGEIRVLGRHDRPLQGVADLVVGHPFMLQAEVGVAFAEPRVLLAHHRAGAGVLVLVPDHQAEQPELVQQHGADQRHHHAGDDPEPGPAALAGAARHAFSVPPPDRRAAPPARARDRAAGRARYGSSRPPGPPACPGRPPCARRRRPRPAS